MIDGFALYREIEDTGEVLERHLIRIPLLLVMAIFYRRPAESVRFLSSYDPVTRLLNRRQFARLLGQQLTTRTPVDRRKALLSLDLDGFKLINETLGPVVRDQLLKAAARLKQCCGRPTRSPGWDPTSFPSCSRTSPIPTWRDA